MSQARRGSKGVEGGRRESKGARARRSSTLFDALRLASRCRPSSRAAGGQSRPHSTPPSPRSRRPFRSARCSCSNRGAPRPPIPWSRGPRRTSGSSCCAAPRPTTISSAASSFRPGSIVPRSGDSATVRIAMTPGLFGVDLSTEDSVKEGAHIVFSYAIHFIAPAAAREVYGSEIRFERFLGVGTPRRGEHPGLPRELPARFRSPHIPHCPAPAATWWRRRGRHRDSGPFPSRMATLRFEQTNGAQRFRLAPGARLVIGRAPAPTW